MIPEPLVPRLTAEIPAPSHIAPGLWFRPPAMSLQEEIADRIALALYAPPSACDKLGARSLAIRRTGPGTFRVEIRFAGSDVPAVSEISVRPLA